jgi:hypothetical protein
VLISILLVSSSKSCLNLAEFNKIQLKNVPLLN